MTGLYIHVPFCKSKCPYCDFYSLTEASTEILQSYTDRMCQCIKEWFGKLSDSQKQVDSIYFGGGTPSILPCDMLDSIMRTISEYAQLKEPQVCIEVNPATVNYDTLRRYHKMGINRLSIGMQSAIDSELKKLGRIHTLKDVEETVNAARLAGFDNISLDLMLGIPDQTMDSMKQSIEKCIGLGADHISMYMLKLEPSTPFGKKPPKNIADEDMMCDMYLEACSIMEQNDLLQYEISNWCKGNKRSRHNMKYWQCEEYLGIGPGAHSFMDGRRFYYERDFVSFSNGTAVIDDGIGGDEEEYIMLRLRLNDGINYNEYEQRFGLGFPAIYIKRAQTLAKTGLIKMHNSGFYMSREGMLVSNSVIGFILTGR